MPAQTENRSGPRYLASLEVKAEWDEPSGTHVVAEGTTENVGPEGTLVRGCCHQRGVPPVRGTHDRDTRGIHIALFDGPVDGVDQIELHAATPVVVSLAHERRTATLASPEVDLQTDEPGGGQPLDLRGMLPFVASPRSTMDKQDCRGGQPAPCGHGHITTQSQAVTSRQLEGVHGHRPRVESGAAAPNRRRPPRAPVPNHISRR